MSESKDQNIKTKLKSFTFYFAAFTLILVPASWFIDHYLKMQVLDYVVEHDLENVSAVNDLATGLPLEGIISLATFTISLFVAGRRGRDIVEKANKNKGSNNVS